MICPKCKSEKVVRLYIGVKNIRKCNTCEHTFNTQADVRQIAVWEAQKETRPEKVEEIKAVWDSPNFKTNAQRLVYLLRHCKSAEYGYTTREFAHGIFPESMNIDIHIDGGWGEYNAKRAVHQMFRRFRHDVTNHEIILLSRFVKLKDGIGRWYHYNMKEDPEGFREYELIAAKRSLGIKKAIDRTEDIFEMSEEERNRKQEEFARAIELKHAKRLERKNKKKAKK
jgi:hypothetical protein